MPWYDIALLPFIAAIAVTTITTPLTIFLVKRFKVIDDPNRKHPGIIHAVPIPRGGGIPLFLGALVAGLLFLPMTKITIAIFFASLLALIVGFTDDILNARSKDVSPYLRFLIIILCAFIVVGSGVSIPFITNPLTGGILHLDTIILTFFPGVAIALSDVIAVLWIIWVMNMLNWSKGVDGQMPGIVAISAITIGVLSLRFPLTDQFTGVDATLSFIIAGAAVGFLIYNFYPARIFPGWGATAIYLLLAVTSMLSSAKLATAILVMGVPTVDAIFTISRRLLARRSPFHGDNLHLHHMLLRLNYNQRQIALFYWILSAILGIISLTLQSRSKVFAIIMLIVIVGGALLFLHLSVKYTHEKASS